MLSAADAQQRSVDSDYGGRVTYPGVARGEWGIRELEDGFALIVRPRIGLMPFVSLAYALAFGALGVTALAGIIREPPPTGYLLLSVLVVFVCFGFVALSAIGIRWLTFGWSVLEIRRGQAVITYCRHVARPRTLDAAHLDAVELDRGWAPKSYWLNRDAFGVGVDRGPLVFTTPGDTKLHFGGNIGWATAQAAREALLRRLLTGSAESHRTSASS